MVSTSLSEANNLYKAKQLQVDQSLGSSNGVLSVSILIIFLRSCFSGKKMLM